MSSLEFNRVHFESLDSTSSYARRNAEALPLPCIITASHQTSGRGRTGKSFFSPKDTGLYMTLLIKANPKASLITPAAAVAVCKAIEKLTDISPSIKWVNDIFVGGKKVCGILSECFCIGGATYIAVGVGINLTTAEFPEELKQAASLGIDCRKDELSTLITEGIAEYINSPDDDIIRDEYESRLFVIGKTVNYEKNGIPYTATVEGINNSCNLIVKNDDGSHDILSSGEISIKL